MNDDTFKFKVGDFVRIIRPAGAERPLWPYSEGFYRVYMRWYGEGVDMPNVGVTKYTCREIMGVNVGRLVDFLEPELELVPPPAPKES